MTGHPLAQLLHHLREAQALAEAVFAEEQSAGRRLSPRAQTAAQRVRQVRLLVEDVGREMAARGIGEGM